MGEEELRLTPLAKGHLEHPGVSKVGLLVLVASRIMGCFKQRALEGGLWG